MDVWVKTCPFISPLHSKLTLVQCDGCIYNSNIYYGFSLFHINTIFKLFLSQLLELHDAQLFMYLLIWLKEEAFIRKLVKVPVSTGGLPAASGFDWQYHSPISCS